MYATSTVNNATTLLTDLVAFVVANGWTVDTDVVEGAGRRVTISKIANMYIHLRLVVNEVVVTGVAYSNGICMLASRSNNLASANANNEWSGLNGILATNPSLNLTYHFFSAPDGNSIHIAVVGACVDDPSADYAVFGGFGTSINKTTTLNEGWFVYTQGAGNANILNRDVGIRNELNSFMLSAGPQYYNNPQFGIFTTSPFYGNTGNDMYSTQGISGENGALPLMSTSAAGCGSYYYMYRASASTLFANSVLIPSYIFMRNPTVGFNLIGSVPGLWLSSAVGAPNVQSLYRNGQVVVIDGVEYAVFRNNVYRIDH